MTPDESAISSTMSTVTASPAQRIVLVDDEPYFRAQAALVLRQAGYEVRERCGCDLNFRLTARDEPPERFDLLVVSLDADKTAVMHLLRRMREEGIGVPLLVITGYVNGKLLHDLHKMDPVELLVKPYTSEDLLAAVQPLVKRDSRQQDSLSGGKWR